ncbi:MAG: hypothetical protein RIR64_122 [Bacteroidota bacterium]
MIRYTLCIFDLAMKKLIFFFCFLIAIIHPHITYSKGVLNTHDFKISQKQSIPIQNFILADISYNDDYLISEADDDIDEAVRKNISLNKANSKTVSFIIEDYSLLFLNKIWSNKYLYYLHSPLFIFISVFRL